MSFGAAKSISQRLSIVAKYEVLILDFSDVPHLGVTASLAIENMINEACTKNRQIFLVGARGNVKQRLINLHILDKIPSDNHVNDRFQALEKSLLLLNLSKSQESGEWNRDSAEWNRDSAQWNRDSAERIQESRVFNSQQGVNTPSQLE